MFGFCKDFSVLRADFGRFRVRGRAQPTCKCCAREVVNLAVAVLRQAAALPRLDVNRPPLAPGRVLEMFRTHRRFFNAAERTRYGTTVHSRKVVQESDAYTPD